jgi:hypothetical protein
LVPLLLHQLLRHQRNPLLLHRLLIRRQRNPLLLHRLLIRRQMVEVVVEVEG